MFFVLTFVAAAFSVVAPLLLLRFCVQKWHIHPKTFWKAGFAGLLVSLVVLGVNLNIDGAFPGFRQLPDLAQALIFGFLSALFIELGKFLILDRWMKKIRNRETALMFGMGWSGVGIIFTGLILGLGVFGMQGLVETKDIASTLPNADAEQLKLLEESQKQIQMLVAGSPLKALSPVLENTATFLVDIAMALLIIFGLNKGQTRYTWMAVGVRMALSTSLFFVAQTNVFPLELVFAGWILVGAGFIAILKKLLPPVTVQ